MSTIAAVLKQEITRLARRDPKVTQRYSHLSSKSMQEAANSASIIIKAASAIPVAEIAAAEVVTEAAG